MRAYTREEEMEFKIKNLKSKYLLVLIISLTIALPLGCKAFSLDELFDDIAEWFSGESNEADIINEVNVSTNTGDTIINGEIQEGETKSKVYVKNIINGEEVASVDIESEENKVKVESEITVKDNKALVQKEIQIDSETETENYEVDLPADSSLDNQTGQGILEESLRAWQEFWNSFLASLQSFFQNLFNF